MSAPITGRKVLIVMVLAFGLIIAVNLTLAFQAVRTFPGVEVDNSYIASQTFDRDRDIQVSLGWDVSAHVDKTGHLVLNITDKDGKPVRVASLEGTFGRATSVAQDQTPDFEFTDGAYRARVTYAPGNWNLRFKAVAEDGRSFRQRVVVIVDEDPA